MSIAPTVTASARALGKKSFSEQQLVENYAALYTEILRVKPSSAKGKYVKSISVSSTMGPGVKVDPAVQRDFLLSNF